MIQNFEIRMNFKKETNIDIYDLDITKSNFLSKRKSEINDRIDDIFYSSDSENEFDLNELYPNIIEYINWLESKINL